MGTSQKNLPNDQKKNDQSSDLKSFVERLSTTGNNPIRATGVNKYRDEQNKMIDTHNLRK